MKKLIIIGGGASGIMAAICAKRNNSKLNITLFEKNPRIGRKILVSGAGRCNLTNKNYSHEHFFGANPKFVSTIINQFKYQDIVEFFANLGIELYEETKNKVSKGKMFPTTNEAKTVTEILEYELNRLGVEVLVNCEVTEIIKKDENFALKYKQFIDVKNVKERTITADTLILSTGGKSYPQLGSDGVGYGFAESLGHKIVKPVPTAVPLLVDDIFVTRMAGVRVDATVSLSIDNKPLKISTDQLMFTKQGLSGPVIFNISRDASIGFHRKQLKECSVKINFVPHKTGQETKEYLGRKWEKSNMDTLHSLYGLVPTKLAKELVRYLKIDNEKEVNTLTGSEKNKIFQSLTNFKLEIDGTKGWEEAEFTCGGIDTREVKSTLESKIVPNLYFCGEILNIDGEVGGFNLSWAWSSGFVAGKLHIS